MNFKRWIILATVLICGVIAAAYFINRNLGSGAPVATSPLNNQEQITRMDAQQKAISRQSESLNSVQRTLKSVEEINRINQMNQQLQKQQQKGTQR